MTDSDLRRQVLVAVAYGASAIACICIALSEWIRSGQGTVALASGVLSVLLFAVFVAMVFRCARLRSGAGKAEVSFITLKDGVQKKEPPVLGKPPHP